MGLEEERKLEPEHKLYKWEQEGDSRHLAEAERLFDLAVKAERAKQDPSWATMGHIAVTLVKYPNLRAVLIVMKRGSSLKDHVTTGSITVHTLTGHVQLKVQGQTVDLPSGGLLSLERQIPHDLEALEESTVLLTIAI